MSASSALAPDLAPPVVSIVTDVDRSRISKVSPYDVATFTWQPDQPVLTYEVRAVPSTSSPHQTGVPIRGVHGSVNTSGSDRIEASESVTTSITGADLEAASPGSARKVVKVFVRNLAGKWSM